MGLFDKLINRNVLYYPGCLSKYARKEISENYQQILRKLGINFITLEAIELCCGSPALNAGYARDFGELKQKNIEIFKKFGIGKIITACPACFKIFSEHYKEIKVEYITQTIMKYINRLDIKYNEKIAYHDPCHLGRGSNIYQEPRKILEALGFTIVEFDKNKENSFCCGGGAGLKSNHPEIANNIARLRLMQSKVKKIVTTCPLCYAHLKENADDKYEVYELSEFLKEF